MQGACTCVAAAAILTSTGARHGSQPGVVVVVVGRPQPRRAATTPPPCRARTPQSRGRRLLPLVHVVKDSQRRGCERLRALREPAAASVPRRRRVPRRRHLAWVYVLRLGPATLNLLRGAWAEASELYSFELGAPVCVPSGYSVRCRLPLCLKPLSSMCAR
jgi:hypothetical protein